MKTNLLILFAVVSFNTVINAQNNNYWEIAWIKFQMDKANGSVDLRKFDWDDEARSELKKASDDYINSLQANNSFLYAPEIDDYLSQKLKVIYPTQYSKSEYSHIGKIQIIKSYNPEIQVLNNGYILLTTGMLSLISNEDELNALLIQQIAKVVFDLNYSSYKDNRSGLMTSFIIGTTVGAITQGVLDNKHPKNSDDNYFLGTISGTTAGLISNSIFNAIANGYNKDLIMKVDSVTIDFMKQQNINQSAFGDILSKIYLFNKSKNNLSDDDPSQQLKFIPKRLTAIGYKYDKQKKEVNDIVYDRLISEALNQNAANLYGVQYFEDAMICVNRVIESGYGIEDTYLIKALILSNFQASDKTNDEILKNLTLAESIPTNNSFEIDHVKGLIYFRMKSYTLAIESFTNAKRKLENNPSGYEDELIWLNKMIAKCKLN